jgi:hypothetical protein
MGCPFKDTCIGDKQEMAISVMKKRQSTVEPVIGSLVGNHGMKHKWCWEK